MRKRLLIMLGMLVVCLQLLAQTRMITGRITDGQGNAVPNASVTVKGTSLGTTTNADGAFSINVQPGATALIVSSVGFANQEVTIGNQTYLTISLSTATNSMDEVVVVAYGTAKRGSFTGSAAQIDAREIEQRPIVNVTNAIAGAAPGVQANAGSGQPGSGPAIRVRGFGSINASNDPLFVVDGVPYDLTIANLNADDIESISVLKDASTTSLYGSRAANGVIMITTKKGKKGRNQVSAKVLQGVTSQGIPEYDRVDAFQYYPLMWEAYRNSLAYSGTTPIATANQNATNNIKGLLGYNPFNVPDNAIVGTDGTINPNAQLLWADDLDWFEPLRRTGTRGDYSVAFNGGAERNDYYVSLGYVNEKGFVLRSDYERFTGRVNVNTQPLSWFRTGLNLSTVITKSDQASDGSSTGYVNPFYFSRNMGPIYPVHMHDPVTGAYVLDANGNRQFDLGNSSPTMTRASSGSPGRHVVAETMWNDNMYKRNVLSARTFGEISFLRNFKFTTNISVDISNYKAATYENKIVGDGAPAGRASRTNSTTTTYTLNQLLNYSRTFGAHNIDLLAGHENYDYNYEYLTGSRQQQSFDGITELENFTTTNNLSSYTDKNRIESFLSRANYSYDNKYLFSASFRSDGSSKFAKDVRWGKFWSVGAGWRLDQESFLKTDWINMLKLRSSYGETGNNGGIGFYAWQGLYSLGFDNVTAAGVLQGSLENPELTWETNKQFDIGLDFSLFKNRVNGSFEFFHRQSDNLLFAVNLPVSSGTLTQTRNIGSMFNRGLEMQVAVDVVRNNNFTWNLDVNATTFKNEITKMPDGQPEIIDGTKKLMVGHSIYDYWLRDYYGVDPEDGRALYAMNAWAPANSRITKNGDSVSTLPSNAKFIYAGTAIPDVFGGISNTFSYKGLSLSVLFTYQIGGKIYDGAYAGLMSSGSYGSSIHTDILNRWKQPGDETNVPRMDVARTGDFNAASDRWLIDGSYITLRSANLSYALPDNLARAAFLQSARVYLSGENLFMKSARKGMNAAQSFTGVTSNAYMPARIITLGLNVTL